MLPLDQINDSVLAYLPVIRKAGFPVYYLVIGLVFLGLGSLFFIEVSISVQAQGIIRPAQERTSIRSLIPGIIDSLYGREGDRVEKNACILSIRNRMIPVQRQLNAGEIALQKNLIHDLLLITGSGPGRAGLMHLLSTPLYREQASRFFSQDAEQRLNIKKADREAAMGRQLIRDKVISPKAFFDTQVQQAKAASAYLSFRRQQFAFWQQDLMNCRLKLNELSGRQEELRELEETCRIRAPVAGILQGLVQRYPGSAVQPDEVLCSISPEGQVLGECYVAARDAGMLRPGQTVRFQMDAFNYNHFGMAGGSILSVDDDYTLVDKKPVFKVICQFDQPKSNPRTGFRGQLKKGLTFRARFIFGRRTLWQLLYGTLDDRVNPLAPDSE